MFSYQKLDFPLQLLPPLNLEPKFFQKPLFVSSGVLMHVIDSMRSFVVPPNIIDDLHVLVILAFQDLLCGEFSTQSVSEYPPYVFAAF
jgi:hypothetical protein